MTEQTIPTTSPSDADDAEVITDADTSGRAEASTEVSDTSSDADTSGESSSSDTSS